MFGTIVTSPVAVEFAVENVALSVYRILRGEDGVAEVGLGGPVLEARSDAEERRHAHHDQDREDHHDDHQLDQGESVFLVAQPPQRCDEHRCHLLSCRSDPTDDDPSIALL